MSGVSGKKRHTVSECRLALNPGSKMMSNIDDTHNESTENAY